jgi:peptidoglycan/xylan/chitin deacetylase (PgdA/CDA1 family)
MPLDNPHNFSDSFNSGIFTLSFDDASYSQLEFGFPVLKRNRMSGVVFVPTGLVGGSFMGEPVMPLSELRVLARTGWEIGSHTVTHARLADREGRLRLSRPELEAELTQSKRWLAENGFDAIAFAYPYGRYNEEIEMLAERDYRYIRTTADGVNPIAASNSRMWSYNLCERKVPRWKRAVDEAAQTKTWVIGVAHHIAASVDAIPLEDEANWITCESLEDCLHYALDAGLSCRTFAQVRAACCNF